MQRILRTIPSYFPNVSGPANQARAISRGLVPYGYTSSIVTTNLGADHAPRHEHLDGIDVFRSSIQTGVMQYHVALQAYVDITRSTADVVHAHSYRNFLTDIVAITARRRTIPYVLHLHGTLAGYRMIIPKTRWWVYRVYDGVTAPLPTLRADRIIVSTTAEAEETIQYGIHKDQINVIPMGIDPTHYTFDHIRRDHRHIVFVGRLTEDRNPELLIRALAALRDVAWSCAFVGAEVRRSYATPTGYTDKLKKLAHACGIVDRVTFTGQLHGERLRHAYAQAGIFVYPSQYENFGQTILEAAAAGCVPVTTRVGVAHDLVRDGDTGFLVEHHTPDMLAQRLRWLLEHPNEQQRIGESVRRATARNYAWTPILQSYADLYQDVLDEQRCRSLFARKAAI
jgi:glycosyltransferase involved in cell wall biosynthesis